MGRGSWDHTLSVENGGHPNPAGSLGVAGSWGCPCQQLWSLPDPTLLCRRGSL